MEIIVSNKTGETDGPAHSFLSHVNSPVPIVLVARSNNFIFNDALFSIGDYVLVDFVENGWNYNWERGSHLFGKNTENFNDIYPGEEWERFDDFVKNNPPKLYFKRELLKSDVSDVVKPIEYPNWQQPVPIQTREEFDARPVSAFFFWGRSHEDRLRLHGNIWNHAVNKGFSVCDNIYQFNNFLKEEKGEKWVSLHMPHYSRVDISHMIAINGVSKISISLPGAGYKCFRSTGESPLNSVMLKWKDELAWSYEWLAGFNCIECRPQDEIATIDTMLKSPRLYDIYCEGVETANKYGIVNYINNYIQPLINERL